MSEYVHCQSGTLCSSKSNSQHVNFLLSKVYWLVYGQMTDNHGLIPSRNKRFVCSPEVQIGFGAHAASCAVGTGSKVAAAWSWELTSI
jgi:hypothetical protein